MRDLTVFLIAIVLLLPGVAPLRAQPTLQPAATMPTPHERRVLIISIDGLRPDLMLRANTPHLRQLMAGGSFTFWAQTTDVAITLPSHTSMLTGVIPARHGISWNSDADAKPGVYPAVPTLFELAKKGGFTSAMVAGKSKFDALNKPGTIDYVSLPEKPVTQDALVAQNAVAMIHDHQPQVLFVHFPEVDTTGHHIGWGTPEQIAAIEVADKCVGRVVAALEQSGHRRETLIIVSADHGGSGRTHGRDDPRSRYIPWIVNGPGVTPNADLTLFRELTVHTEDTFATACTYLGLTLPEGLDGKPVQEIYATMPENRAKVGKWTVMN